MKKILIAFDGVNYSEGALNFALQLHKRSPVLVTGVFIPEAYFASLWSYSIGVPAGLIMPLDQDEETEEITRSIRKFEHFCESNDMPFTTHRKYDDFSINALVQETRFADLLLIGGEKFYQIMGTELNEYLKETLRNAECPVLVVPEKFEFPSSQILAYDGTQSSVFAMKQFSYLFPELAGNDTLLLYMSEKDEEIPHLKKLEELAKQHFDKVSFLHLQMNPEKYFASWMEDRKNPILVCGAYGRSGFSRVFRKSFVTDILKKHNFPVFISHC